MNASAKAANSNNRAVLQINLLCIEIPMKKVFESAVGSRRSKEAVIIECHLADGTIGFGELSSRPDPYFSAEFNDAAILTLSNFLIPQIVGLDVERAYNYVLRSKVRGWSFTRAALLASLSDAFERSSGTPQPSKTIKVGATLGLPQSWSILQSEMTEKFAAGYSRVRMKANPTTDVQLLVRACTEFASPDRQVAIDFNGSLDYGDRECKRILDCLGAHAPAISFVEQPFAPSEILEHARLKRRHSRLRVSLDESINTLGDLKSAVQLGALDLCNVKPGRVGGERSIARIAEYCDTHEISSHIGGMFETGIGRWANGRMAARYCPETCHDMTLPADYLLIDVVVENFSIDSNTKLITIPDRPARIDIEALYGLTKNTLNYPEGRHAL